MQSRKDGQDEGRILFNELAGNLGGDGLLDWSHDQQKEGVIAMRSIVSQQTGIVIEGPNDFISIIGVTQGIVEIGGRGANRWVALTAAYRT